MKKNLLLLTAFCLMAISNVVEAQDCNYNNDFSEPVPLSETRSSFTWYTDRYAPKMFKSQESFGGNLRLKHSIDISDGGNARPSSFNASLYNTQGRSYDMGSSTIYMEIMLYVPSAWATTGRRMAGFWAILADADNEIAGYPNIEFTSENNKPRFTGYNNGQTQNIGLPSNFQFNSWVKLSITVKPNSQVLYQVGDLHKTAGAYHSNRAVRMRTVILQGFNTTEGVTYDIYWDDFKYQCYRPCPEGEVVMCHNGKNECVKTKDVARKNAEKGWSLGPCGVGIDQARYISINDELNINPKVDITTGSPTEYKLSNFPNPFSISTTIKYDVPVDSRVSLQVFNLAGQQIATLFEGNRKAGSYTVEFRSNSISKGTYLCKLTAVSVTGAQQTIKTQQLSVTK